MESRAWIFVSHSSADLPVVRLVRNYLEAKGASPLLFHLRALTDPNEFWPLIKREIQARRFFIYCESEAAAASQWVRRERNAVAALGSAARRIATIRVDGPDIDRAALDDLVRATRVFPNFASTDRHAVAPFLDALRRVGFEVFDPIRLDAGFNWKQSITDALQAAAAEGWVVSFISTRALQSRWVEHEIAAGLALGARFVPVLLEPVPPHTVALPPVLADVQAVDGTAPDAPGRLAEVLLQRDVG